MLADIIFVLIAIMTLVGAMLAVGLKNVFHNALALIMSLFGVACLFIYLNSEFLAILEVIIYIGAITIAIIFAIMLSQPMLQRQEPRSIKKILKSLIISVLLFIGIVRILNATTWPEVNPEGNYSIREIGKELLTTNVLPFEAVSLVLLVAIVGALLISSQKDTT